MFGFDYFVGIMKNSELSSMWNALGAIGQWLGALATFLAAFIALRTSKDAKKTYMIDQRPYVAFDSIEPTIFKKENARNILLPEGQQKQDGIQVGVVLRNVGKTIANFRVIKYRVEANNKTDPNPNFKTSGGVIYPGMVNIYRFPIIECPIDKHVSGVVEYLIEYCKDWNDTVYTSEKKVSFDIFLQPTPQTRWLFLHENEGTKPRSFLRKVSDILGI